MTARDEALRALEKEIADVIAADLRAHPMKIETTNQRAERLAKRIASAILSARQEVAPVAYRWWLKARDGGGHWVFEHPSTVEALNLQRIGYEPLYTSPAHTSEARDGEIARLRRCLGFFASVIKSGESWSATCQSEYDAAMEASR